MSAVSDSVALSTVSLQLRLWVRESGNPHHTSYNALSDYRTVLTGTCCIGLLAAAKAAAEPPLEVFSAHAGASLTGRRRRHSVRVTDAAV